MVRVLEDFRLSIREGRNVMGISWAYSSRRPSLYLISV